MDKLLKAIQDNDLAQFVLALNEVITRQQTESDARPAKTNAEMIQLILAQTGVSHQTRAIIEGIGQFLEARGFVSERQLDTIHAMYKQHCPREHAKPQVPLQP